MPGILIDEKEIKAQGKGIVKGGGNLYIEKGRQYIGMKVRYFVMEEE